MAVGASAATAAVAANRNPLTRNVDVGQPAQRRPGGARGSTVQLMQTRAAHCIEFSPRRLHAAGLQIPRRSLVPPATEELWRADPHSATSGVRFGHRETPERRGEQQLFLC
jgi:hypothetical protein